MSDSELTHLDQRLDDLSLRLTKLEQTTSLIVSVVRWVGGIIGAILASSAGALLIDYLRH